MNADPRYGAFPARAPTPAGIAALFEPGRRLYVDGSTALATADQNGTAVAPYKTIQQAIDRSVADALPALHVLIAYGIYADPIVLPDSKQILLEGAIRSSQMLVTGTIRWTVTGSGASQLHVRNVQCTGLLTVLDGAPPATNAVLTYDNSACAGIAAAGTSHLTISMGGFTLASFDAIVTPVVAAVVRGPIAVADGDMLAQSVQFEPTCTSIACTNMLAFGCSFDQSATLSGIAAEFSECIWNSAQAVTFSGAAGTVKFHGGSVHSFVESASAIVNGAASLIRTGGSLFLGPTAIDPVSPLFPASLYLSASPYLGFVLGSQVDGGYSGGPGNGALFAGARASASGTPPMLAPFVGFQTWDWGSGIGPGAGRELFFGGGGWVAPDATSMSFWTASTYGETPDTGALRFSQAGETFAFGATAVRYDGQITASFSGSNNNVSPTGLSTAQTIRASCTAATTWTGLAGGAQGREILVWNVATNPLFTLTLTHEDALSTAANRFLLSAAAPLVVPAGGSVRLRYDGVSSRYRPA